MSLLTVRTAMIGKLQTVAGVRTVEPFAGDLEALFRDTSPRPALHVLYAGTAYGEQETLGAAVQPLPGRKIWTVLIAVSGRKSVASTDADALELIEDVVEALTGFAIGEGHLWPQGVAFLKSKNGVLVYGADFYLDTED